MRLTLSPTAAIFVFLLTGPKAMAAGSSDSSAQSPLSFDYSAKSTQLDPSLYPAPPAGLELEQVNVFVRHGEEHGPVAALVSF